MPVATAEKIIFIHIPKSGGTSIMSGLRRAGIEFDLDGQGIWDRLGEHPRGADLIRRLREVYPLHSVTGFWENHLPAEILRELIAPQIWLGAFKFSFVRNPWDLVVSTFTYLHEQRRSLDVAERDFAEVMKHWDFPRFVREYPLLFADQSSMIADKSGKPIVDFVGRFETIQKDYETVCDHLCLAAALPWLNASEHANYRDYYDAQTRYIIERQFARDIDLFGYSF